jgi:hypothetical protein
VFKKRTKNHHPGEWLLGNAMNQNGSWGIGLRWPLGENSEAKKLLANGGLDQMRTFMLKCPSFVLAGSLTSGLLFFFFSILSTR